MKAKTIVILGASSGIGAALTQALSGDGHRLFVCARRRDRLQALTEDGKIATYRVVDVANEAEVAAFAKDVQDAAANVDAIICCAGAYGPIGRFQDIDSAAWLATLQTNLFGTFLAAKYFVPLMKPHAGARILTLSGGGAFNALPRYSAYATSKAGIVRLTETIAEELRPLGIAANGIAPGFVATEIHNATLAAGAEAAGEAFHAMTRGKMAEGSVPMEVPVNCVRFLLSERADGLTGKTLSASFDPWQSDAFQADISVLNASELYTMRRVNPVNLPDDPLARKLAKP